jgi:2-aminoethylphosphonate-pyruvate transaminase
MAAGIGSRFKQYTETLPKGFVNVGGKPMIVRSIEVLLSCGINRIIIGTGYKKEVYDTLKEMYPQIETCYSPLYAQTNSMYTLYNTRETIGDDDFVLLESDLIFEQKAIVSIIECDKSNVMLISSLTKFQDEYFVEYNYNNQLTNCSINEEDLDVKGELVGIHKLSNHFYKSMCEDYAKIMKEQPNLGYEYELLRMSRSILPIYVLQIENLKWYEIDDESDLQYAEKYIVQYF